MMELLLVITACFITSEVMIRKGSQQGYLVPLAFGCGLTITTLIAFVLAQVYATETWMNYPFDWIIADPFHSLLTTIVWWSLLSGILLRWQHERSRLRRQLPRPLEPENSLTQKNPMTLP